MDFQSIDDLTMGVDSRDNSWSQFKYGGAKVVPADYKPFIYAGSQAYASGSTPAASTSNTPLKTAT